MRKLGLLLLFFIIITSSYAQDTEYSVHLNSGLFSFNGKSATEFTYINQRSDGSAYTNNPYGSNNALSYGLTGQAQRITQSHFVFGLQSGYEILRSSVHITGLNAQVEASGNTIFQHTFVNIYPFLGYRFSVWDFDMDVTVGPEAGLPLSSKEIGEATLNDGSTISTNYERNKPNTDYRLRTSVTGHYKKWGLSVGYSYGLYNYRSGWVGGVNKAYARFIRFGISYELF